MHTYVGDDLQKSVTTNNPSSDARRNLERTCSSRPRLQRRRRSVQPVVFENTPRSEEAKGTGRRSGKTDD